MKKKTKKATEKKSDHYKTQTYMFPKNHNNIIRMVAGIWDENIKKGESLIEHIFPNAYMPKKFTEVKLHDDKEKMLDAVRKHVNDIDAENNKNEYNKTFESETSFFISFYNGLEVDSVILPSCPINILEENDIIVMTLWCKIKKMRKDAAVFYIDVTNDPTLNFAGGVVSLGYYDYRFRMHKARVINFNPFQIACKKENLRLRLNRPTRRVL